MRLTSRARRLRLPPSSGPQGVHVSAILPGAFETDMYNAMNDTADKQTFMTNLHELVAENFQHPPPPVRLRQRADQR